MAGRITQSMMNAQLLRNMNSSLSRLDKMQNQMSTTRKINKPSDDPVGIGYSMRYRSELAANDQYTKNVDSALSWLDYTDTTLDQANNILQRVREIAVAAGSGTNPQDALNAFKSEVDQLKSQMVQVGNSQFNGKYVFNGQMTDTPPYSTASPEKSQTDTDKVNFEIGVGVRLGVNVTGSEVFGAPDQNVFSLLNQLSDNLREGNRSAISKLVGDIDQRIDILLTTRAEVGAKTNRIQLAQDRLSDIDSNLQTLQSKVEDVDVAALITNMKTEENVYQSSLSVGAKLLQTSLIDFIR